MSIAIILCSILLVGAVSAQSSVSLTITGTVIKQPTQCNTYKPLAIFDLTPNHGFTPVIVTFKDRSIMAPTSWNWSFGDGTFSNIRNPPAHTYKKVGMHRVVLTVKNCAGISKMDRYVWVFPRWWWIR